MKTALTGSYHLGLGCRGGLGVGGGWGTYWYNTYYVM